MTTREQLEAEAEELYPITKALDVDHTAIVIAHRRAHIHAKTVSAEQVQAVARVLDGQNGNLFNEEALAEDALDAAGLLIEGDDQ